MAPLLKPREQVAGYEIFELVGKGGMGEVYRAKQLSMDRMVALKVLSAKLVKRDPSFAKRFIDEARAAGRLNHPNIIGVHDVGKAPMPSVDGQPGEEIHYFSMEFVDGETVKDVIERETRCPAETIAMVMSAMGEAVGYAEAHGIVHRDIKPDNIMITAAGTVKLADLGLATQVGGEEVVEVEGEAKKRSVMGTPLYMSPEQARGLTVSPQSDQYSLGATLFHMLTGKPPFAGPSASTSKEIMRAHVVQPVPDPKDVLPEVAEGWRQLCIRLMAKDPAERFASAKELKAAIKLAASAQGNAARRLRSGAFKPAESRQRSPVGKLAAIAVVVVVVIGAASAVAMLGGGGGDKPVDPVGNGPITPITVEPTPEQVAQTQAQALIAGLGGDDAKAIARLDKALADQALAPARDLLAKERARRDQAIRDRGAKAVQEQQAKLAEITQLITAGDLVGADTKLRAIAAGEDRSGGKLAETRAALDQALAAYADQAAKQVAAAATPDALGTVHKAFQAVPLAKERRDALEAAVAQRQQAFAAAAAAIALAAKEKPCWQALAAVLEPMRYSTRYMDLGNAATAEVEKFPTPDSQDLARQFVELASLAQRSEGYLRNHIKTRASTAPIAITLRINGENKKLLLINLTDKDIQYRPAIGAVQKVDRQVTALAYRELLDQAISNLPSDVKRERSRLMAAFLWVWRPADVPECLNEMADDKLAQALGRLEANRKSSALVVRAIRREDGSSLFAYDFLGRDAALLRDFVGQGAALGDSGMSWRTDVVIGEDDRAEASLPTLRWKGAVRPPVTIEATVRLNRDTQLALVGVAAGTMRARVGFNLKQARLAVGSLFTGDEVNFSIGTTQGAHLLDIGQPVKIEISIDERYRAHLLYNGTLVERDRQLPTNQPISVVFQILQTAPGSTGSIVVESLNVQGRADP